jgi:hypothetical protein
VDVKGWLKKVTIDQLYNQKFKNLFLYYPWVESFIVRRYNLNNHKQGKFHPLQRNHSLLYTPTTCIETIDHNLIWDDFEQFYAFIIFS